MKTKSLSCKMLVGDKAHIEANDGLVDIEAAYVRSLFVSSNQIVTLGNVQGHADVSESYPCSTVLRYSLLNDLYIKYL